jgi:hypothetical protein
MAAVAPFVGLAIEVVGIAESARGEEAIAYKTNGALGSTFSFRRATTTGRGSKR